MSSSEEVRCPIGGSHAARRIAWPAIRDQNVHSSDASDAYFFHCNECKPFVLSVHDTEALDVPPEQLNDDQKNFRANVLDNRFKLLALLWEHHAQQLPTPWLQLRAGRYGPVDADRPVAQIAIEEFLRRWPVTVSEKLNRILRNLGKGTDSIGTPCHLGERSFSGDKWFSILFSESKPEAEFYLAALEERGFIRDVPEKKGVTVTPTGWAHIDDLQRDSSSHRHPAFVAMWFGGETQVESAAYMNELYELQIRTAIEGAGYKVDRVDLVAHNDFIMDKIMGMIRVAPFVVADFTGNRGGVYFEAGFARGLSIPVIHTCRKSHFDQAHFDIRQVNTIVWDAPGELGEKLRHRILGTLGLGPFGQAATQGC